MKKTILTLAGIMALGTTALMADGSTIQVNDNIMALTMNDVEMYESTVGINLQTNDSDVQANGNTVTANITNTVLENSTVGINIVDEH